MPQTITTLMMKSGKISQQLSVPVTKSSNVEKEVIQSSVGAKVTFTHLAKMEQKLLDDAEDVLITGFLELLLMPFIRGIPNTATHGNSHTLRESYVRKIKFAKKHGLQTKVVRGRAPDRTVEFQTTARQKFSVLVMEVKTTGASAKYPDFVKLASEMKDIYDFATSKGVKDYKITGVLVAGAICKLYSLHMPIDKLYCMTEVATFCMPDNINDEKLVEKIQEIAESMLTCVSKINESISMLQWRNESSTVPTTSTINSYPSPHHHYEYYK